ncbi:XrtA/PEP-CTERM system-associated ATPase [Kordiimonas sp. SCSIO 12610]|uniref:XrtA/PEP-CTERM system-associated ATPase n=1 Tax=Kordiimonas sp. SCSIO 12610 TaxID=2829597 RepID=UPI00210C5498|nr:XrtA/PEP-CTERM system-associated ATPase [Kordiimonas sp. SCSIO 12610]UTW54153.1 XrtA-associated ATPase [Kordiimonas sp. SCSIO 12610]
MYEKFYNLNARPFQLTPDPKFYFSSRTHKKAMAYLTYGLHQGEGFIVVTGDIGTGKTTLLRHLFNTLDRDEYVAAMLVSTQLGGIGLLRGVASAFGLSAEGDKGHLLLRIERFLRDNYKNGKRVLLVVDEAQNLSISALEEMRMLSNFQEGDNALLQSFLVGQPEFRDIIFGSPELEQLRQRVIATHHLGPMEKEELADYLEHRLSLVGWKGDPGFTVDAVAAIYDYAAGVPRKLNTLCSRVMLFGALEELHEISGETVRAVIADMSSDTDFEETQSSSSHETQTVDLPEGQSSGRLDQLETIITQQHQMIGQLTKIVERLVDQNSRTEAPDEQ